MSTFFFIKKIPYHSKRSWPRFSLPQRCHTNYVIAIAKKIKVRYCNIRRVKSIQLELHINNSSFIRAAGTGGQGDAVDEREGA